jgi:hypothetical protein
MLFFLAREESVDRSRKLSPSLKELKLEEEKEAHELAAHLLDEFARRPGGTTYWSTVNITYL